MLNIRFLRRLAEGGSSQPAPSLGDATSGPVPTTDPEGTGDPENISNRYKYERMYSKISLDKLLELYPELSKNIKDVKDQYNRNYWE